jgi:hypothetical protein
MQIPKPATRQSVDLSSDVLARCTDKSSPFHVKETTPQSDQRSRFPPAPPGAVFRCFSLPQHPTPRSPIFLPCNLFAQYPARVGSQIPVAGNIFASIDVHSRSFKRTRVQSPSALRTPNGVSVFRCFRSHEPSAHGTSPGPRARLGAVCPPRQSLIQLAPEWQC